MTQEPKPYHWQDKEVILRTVSKLAPLVTGWLEAKGIPIDATKRDTALQAAIIYAGEKADAYQMARWLEDSRSWPADAALVRQLADATRLRTEAIKELEAERAPKPVLPQGNEPLPIGLRFIDAPGPPTGTVYEIANVIQTTIVSTTAPAMRYYDIRRLSDGYKIDRIEEATIRDRIRRYGPQ